MEPYEFWNKIGAPRLVVAPMVDNSELPYRMLTRKYGATLVYTQMFNCNNFVHSKEMRKNLFTTCPEDRPLFAQIAGHNPQMMLAAAKYLEDHCDAIDVNLGCPQGIAKRGKYGAFLMEELELLHDIVSTLVKGLKIPVTCKTRIYNDFETSIRLCETLVNAGASVLTIHGRTRDEKGHLVRACNWHMIARIKEHFSKRQPPIPIIANGGIETYDDVLQCLAITKADAVMSSEAILENPALFVRSIAPELEHKLDVITLTEEYLDNCEKYPIWHTKIIRSHCMKMLYRYIAENTEIRDVCGVSNSIEDFRKVCQMCREYHASAPADKKWISWYMRHRQGGNGESALLHITKEDEKKPAHDPDHLLKLSTSFMRGDCWSNDGDNEEGGEEEGGIFAALNMFE